ncbi:MAG: nitrite/sulfite reductase [Planctomycetota bacterium]|nr:nitrite/sulfite reductase [Planctomycetota bacterium]
MNFDPAMSKNEHLKREKDGLDVWNDIFQYAKTGFASIAESDFARMRWYGIYQQKPNEGHFMWRIKLPGGRLSPKQFREIGQIANDYGRGFGDVTTRQCIQLHWLTIESFPDCLDRIYNKVGLYTDFACGDTPRNNCSCPLDGVIKNQIIDLGDLVQGVSDMFRAGGKEFSNLPRKFKQSIAACPLHCHQPQINDISAFGVIRQRDGREERGLGVMVGGGLSSTPHYAQGLRVFVPQEKVQTQIPEIFRQVAHIFRDADSLRYKRTKARLKFLVADKGWQWFRDELEKRLGYTLEHDDAIVNPRGALHTDHVGTGEQKDGLYYVGIPIERGRCTGDQMIAVANLTEKYGQPGKGQIRLSQKQNILIVNVPKENVDELSRELDAVGLAPHAPIWRESLISCTGTQFCNLAVVETKERAKSILEYLEREVDLDTPIMVSVTGCPNACSQYQIADIGLTGIPSIYNGLKQDGYNVLVGGCLGENPEFGQEIVKKVPAVLVHKVIAALVRNYKENRIVDEDGEAELFRDFVGRNEVEQLVKWADIPEWKPAPPRKAAVPGAPPA